MSAILKVTNLEVAYGHVRAVRGVSLEVGEGEICVILGANGAGKSSIIKAILGLVKPRAGKIEFPEGREIQTVPTHTLNKLGIAWVPEGRQVFANLTVRENLLMGAFHDLGRDRVAERLAAVMKPFPILIERQEQLAGSLSGGEQQMLVFGRALMSNPKLLLLDEPSLGLAPKLVQRLFGVVEEIRESGISILMAEQNANQSLRVAAQAYLLETGEIAESGSASEMAQSAEVRRAYLGG